jgi:hypothetical protein
MRTPTLLVPLLCSTMLAAGVVRTVQARQQPPPIDFTRDNLQVLPKDIPVRDMIGIMRGFVSGLDVRCEHCHVGEGNDLSKFDFASDARPAKAIARQMLQLTTLINERVAGIGTPAAPGTRKVTCFTCHRGATKPATQPPGGGRRP